MENNTPLNKDLKQSFNLPDLLIYHGWCLDGVAAAWCFWCLDKTSAKMKTHPGQFNEKPPDVTDKTVIFVDFAYDTDVLINMLKIAKSITVIDHHISRKCLEKIKDPKFILFYDEKRSGAQLAWDYINGTELTNELLASNRPWFINDVGDRDLWKWEIEGSKASTRIMYAKKYHKSIKAFDEVNTIPRENYVEKGLNYLEFDQAEIDKIVSAVANCVCKEYKVAVVECPSDKVSEVGNTLCVLSDCDFSAMYRYRIWSNDWVICLRSTKPEIDLPAIIKTHFGGKGGGHKGAASFSFKEGNPSQFFTIIR